MNNNPNTNPTPAANASADTRSMQNLLQTAATNGSFKTFGQAVEKAGMTDTLSAVGPFTVFAPTDAAFLGLPSGKLDFLFKPENKPELVALVNNHVINGRKAIAEIGKWSSAKTLDGKASAVKLLGEKVSIDGATVTMADLDSSNGYLHGIDKVNVPTRQ